MAILALILTTLAGLAIELVDSKDTALVLVVASLSLLVRSLMSTRSSTIRRAPVMRSLSLLRGTRRILTFVLLTVTALGGASLTRSARQGLSKCLHYIATSYDSSSTVRE